MTNQNRPRRVAGRMFNIAAAVAAAAWLYLLTTRPVATLTVTIGLGVGALWAVGSIHRNRHHGRRR